MPRPSPKGISTPMMEFRSLAAAPIMPSTSAAMTDPISEPNTTLAPISSAKAAPAKDSSAMPCTAKAMSRSITKMPIMPPTRPSMAPAISELVTSGRISA